MANACCKSAATPARNAPKLDEEFEKEMEGLGDHNFDLETEQHNHQVRALKMYQDYLDDREREEINAQIRSLKRQRDTRRFDAG